MLPLRRREWKLRRRIHVTPVLLVGVTDDCPDLFVALITSLLDETVDVEPLRRVVHHTANPKGADHLRAFLFAAIPTDLSVCQNSPVRARFRGSVFQKGDLSRPTRADLRLCPPHSSSFYQSRPVLTSLTFCEFV